MESSGAEMQSLIISNGGPAAWGERCRLEDLHTLLYTTRLDFLLQLLKNLKIVFYNILHKWSLYPKGQLGLLKTILGNVFRSYHNLTRKIDPSNF